MPLSEFHRTMAKGKPESATQPRMSNCLSDVSSFMPDNEFVELLWENGQIVMQGQSNRPKKSSFSSAFPSSTLRVQDKDWGNAAIPKFGQYDVIGEPPTVNDLSPSVPSANFGLNAPDDDMTPWINYPIEDSLCSEFFTELTGINSNSMPTDRNNSFGVKDLHNIEHGQSTRTFKEGSEQSRTKTTHLFQLPQTSTPNTKSRMTDFSLSGSASTHQGQDRRQDVVPTSKPFQPSSGIGLMNFSHFSRPVALAKANLQTSDRSRSNEKASTTAASTNPIESTLIESAGFQDNSAAKPRHDSVRVEQPEAIRQEEASRNNHHNSNGNKNSTPDRANHQSPSFAASTALARHETEKGPEVVVASSVCSGNSVGAESNDLKHKAKRKLQEGEESGDQSEDLEDDSVGLRKADIGRGGMSAKRSRAAEVHNLSERRRRDRINEKMRALQELIPNCNKVDKASMLDEAIEYLKTLQLQVQMMSMGSGLCMPPMMLPPGMQHIRAPTMAHFSPMTMGMGMGMGMGLGYGMGMLDMNGSPGCPLIPVPSMHAPQFSCPPIPGATGLHGMPGSTALQLFGIPGHGQGLPIPMPRAPSMLRSPLLSPLTSQAAKGNFVTEVPGMGSNPLPVSDAGTSISKDRLQQQQQQSIHLESRQKTRANESQAAKEYFGQQSQLRQASNQTLHASGNGAAN